MENRSTINVNKGLKNIKTMNEIDLTKILKDCPKGTKLYSTIHGEVTLIDSNDTSQHYPISVRLNDNTVEIFTYEGKLLNKFDGECILFPSKDQRDWSKFTASWYKKERFDPNTLQPYDKVLVRDAPVKCWRCSFFSHKNVNTESSQYKYATPDNSYVYCIPYNDETKHLVGTKDEAPMYYRYWED